MPQHLVAIVGRPNTGKSTLFNRLIGERRAILSNIAGTTRDVLFGDVDWNGKTFTVANVIARINRPTLVLAHNKTLAAQLCNELRELFPKNSVHYFVFYLSISSFTIASLPM